jgi:hypothetical protein
MERRRTKGNEAVGDIKKMEQLRIDGDGASGDLEKTEQLEYRRIRSSWGSGELELVGWLEDHLGEVVLLGGGRVWKRCTVK